jgi:hypothetical protein
MEHASITAFMLAGEPSMGTRIERNPDVGSVAAKWNGTSGQQRPRLPAAGAAYVRAL